MHLYRGILVLILLAGCSAPATVTLRENTPSATLPSATLPSLAEAVTPTALPTSTPLLPTLTPTAIPTSIPTLPPAEVKSLLFNLLADNGGCQLPCLWGFTLGKTDLQTVENFLAQFGAFDQDSFYSTGPESFDYSDINYRGKRISVIFQERFGEKGKSFFDISFGYSFHRQGGTNAKILRGMGFTIDSNSVLNFETDRTHVYGSNFPDPFQFYLLPQLLTQLGKPPQVRLFTLPDDPLGNERPFRLALFYPNLGVFVEYEAYREAKGNDYVGCMGQASISLQIEDPAQKMKWSDLVGSDVVAYYKPLEEATSLSLDQFYEQFKDPANTACIHTPQSLWVEGK